MYSQLGDRPADHGDAFEFADPDVADAYRHRPPYPADTFTALSELMPGPSRRMLDLGCGSGFIARPMAPLTDSVDAVDISAAMLDLGRQKTTAASHPNLRWLHGPAESCPLEPGYDLITAGESLHWMDLRAIMARVQTLLAPGGWLAILRAGCLPTPWASDLMSVVARYKAPGPEISSRRVADDLVRGGLFVAAGVREVGPETFVQSIDDYVESFHGRSVLSRRRLGRANAQAFDDAVRRLLDAAGCQEVTQQITARIIWGRPTAVVPPS